MKLKYLGTAAAEGVPGLFCECDVCKRSWEKGGKNIRTRCQAIVDDKILLDLGPDTYMHEIKYGIRLSQINTILITHIHGDHYFPAELENRKPGFAHMEGCRSVEIIGSVDLNEPGMNSKIEVCGKDKPNSINVTYIKPFETIVRDGYEITAIKAVHGTDNPLNYIISKDGKTMLYVHDSSSYDDETWEFLKNRFDHFDLVSMDCTQGLISIRWLGHMNIERNLEFMNKMKELGLCDEKTIFVANHFSHNGGATYDDYVEYTKSMPLVISYDGLEVEF